MRLIPTPLPSVPPLDSLTARVERQRLDLAALRLGYASGEQALRAAVLRRFPRLSAGLSRATDTGGIRTIGPSATIDVPLFDRNQGAIAAATATQEQLRAEYQARVFATRADLATLLALYTRTQAELANAEAALRARQALVSVYGTALRLHQGDVLAYYTARVELLDRALDVLRLRGELAELAVGLEVATGGLLASPSLLP